MQFTLQLSLAGFAEFVMHLTRLNPDMMYLHQDSGLMNLSYFKFDVDDITGAPPSRDTEKATGSQANNATSVWLVSGLR